MAYKTFGVGDVLTAADVNTYLMRQAVVICTSGTRPSSPTEGMTVYETDTDVVRIYTGSAWRRYAVNVESLAPQQAENSTQFDFNNTAASATATTGTAAPVVGVTFTAPPSGAVFVTVSGNIESDQDKNSAVLSYSVRTGSTVGSGTLVQSQSFTYALMTSSAVNTDAAARAGGSHGPRMLTGLTAGAAYNAQTMHWITPGGGGTVYHRAILVAPVL